MLVIHPKDKTTAVLAALYEGEQVRLLDQTYSKADINHHLHHTAKSERIMLPGHVFELNDTHTPLTDFNYSHFYYL